MLHCERTDAVRRELEAIETQLMEIAAAAVTLVEPDAAPVAQAAAVVEESAAAAAPDTSDTAPVWRDEASYTLAPGQGIEVKLVMNEGAVAEFEWTANGAVLNHDTHGDGGDENISYAQGRGVPGERGELVAAFSGNHGWFWRNHDGQDVKVTLFVRGDYSEIKFPQ